MSAVIRQTKQLYQKTLLLELIILAIVAIVIGSFLGLNRLISFIFGEISAFIPHCVFVYWVFFRRASVINPQKMTAFYWGEGFKWLTTIILIIVAFKSYSEMDYLVFFCGFFSIILCNSLLPIVLKLRSK